MILESRGSKASTRVCGIAKQQCRRVELSPSQAADTRTLSMRVRQYRVWSSNAASTQLSGTSLCRAAENRAKGERSVRDPLVLVFRRW